VYIPYASARPEYMSLWCAGMWPSSLHSSKFAQMVQVQVPLPSGFTAALLTIRIHVAASIWNHRVSVCVCGQISCHNGRAHVTDGVISLTRIGIGWYADFGCWCNPGMGRSRWVLVVVMVGVAGTMLDGSDVRLALF